VVDHVFKFFSPNLPIPNPAGYALDAAAVESGMLQTYSWKSLMLAGSGATDDFGRERNLTQAILSSAGVKLASYPPDQLQRNERAKRDAELRDLNETTGRYRREFRRSAQTDADRKLFDERMEKQARKRADINKRFSEKMGQPAVE
jgi:hypothetical protein